MLSDNETSCQALMSPASGLLGDRFDRTHIIALGALLWGVMTFAIGLSTSIHQVTFAQACCCLCCSYCSAHDACVEA